MKTSVRREELQGRYSDHESNDVGNDRQCAGWFSVLWGVIREFQPKQATQAGVDVVCDRDCVHDDRADNYRDLYRDEGLEAARSQLRLKG